MLKYVYVVLCGEERNISGEVYTTYEKAVDFVNNRAGNPQQIDYWHWVDSRSFEYQIKELNLR